ncbi:MAG: DedA family protein [Actinomycetota bacterium]|nr:DedA family protein [Actinomycetota bacterium]
MTHLLLSYGLILLFAAVAVESAGIPVPGETTLIAAAILATPQHHHYSLVAVIAVAAAGAIVGDNVGYWLGRKGGRPLLERWGPVRRYADKALPPAEIFFQKHGAKAVFFGRFIAFLRVTAAWLAGISHMPWWRFLLWNAAGGIFWATGVSLLAYQFGKAAADAVGRYGLYGVAAIVVVGLVVFFGLRAWKKRMLEEA